MLYLQGTAPIYAHSLTKAEREENTVAITCLSSNFHLTITAKFRTVH